MKKNKKRSYPKYAWGGDVDPNLISGAASLGGNLLGQLAGQDTDVGGFFSGAGSGAGLGASIGSAIPGIGTAFGAIGGGLIGGIAGLFGANKKQKAEAARKKAQEKAIRTNYNTAIESQFDTINDNPYGNMVFADGGIIHINPANKGKFTASAKSAGMGVQEFASHVLANKDNYSSTQVKRANFARNATKFKHENGGDVSMETINIEEGELQIDPITGKIIREYNGVNPETGGLYKPHSKGKDTKNNIVSAEPGTFIITKDLAKDYKEAIDTNDRIRRDTILQNIKNTKDSKKDSDKMALGSFVDPTKPPYLSAAVNPWNPEMIIDQSRGLRPITSGSANTGVQSPGTMFNNGISGVPNVNKLGTSSSSENGGTLNNVLGAVANYAPSLLNIGQGLFGKVEQQDPVQEILNPYTNQVLNNLPQDINLNPLMKRIDRNQAAQFRQIDNTTSGNAIARANKNNIFANTQNQLADIYMQEQQANNQIKGQRASIYNDLGRQSIAEKARAQQINLGIEESNVANRAAKSNLLGTGLSQLQQVYQNQRLNKNKQSMDKYKVDLLKQMFPNLKYYGDQFGEDALSKLIG